MQKQSKRMAAFRNILWLSFFILGNSVTILATDEPEVTARKFIDGEISLFNTKNHVKSKGAEFTIAYPNSWVSKEGDRPNIVQKFISENGRGLEMALILTNAIPLHNGVRLTRNELKELFTPTELREIVPSGARLIEAKATEIEGEPAGIIEYALRMERAGESVIMQSWSLIFAYNGTFVQVQFSVGVPDISGGYELAQQRMDDFKPLFHLMANSIIFPEKWTGWSEWEKNNNNNRDSIMDNNSALVFAGNTGYIVVIFDLLATWAIGLLPSILIRYVFLKQPLKRSTASWVSIIIAFIFWISSLALSHSLGETSTAGVSFTAYVLFFISRWILSRGYNEESSDKEQIT